MKAKTKLIYSLCLIQAFVTHYAQAGIAGDLARKYCRNSNTCDRVHLINDIIEYPIEGTCLIISSASRLRFDIRKSQENWWLLISRNISTKQFDQVREQIQVFGQLTKKQTFWAQPVSSIYSAQTEYCTVKFDLTNGTRPIGILIPVI